MLAKREILSFERVRLFCFTLF